MHTVSTECVNNENANIASICHRKGLRRVCIGSQQSGTGLLKGHRVPTQPLQTSSFQVSPLSAEMVGGPRQRKKQFNLNNLNLV